MITSRFTESFRIEMKNVITFIIVLYMLNNLEHSTHVYYGISKKQMAEVFGWKYADWVQSVIVIVVLDLSVIAWIRMNRYWEAGIFEVLILILNLLYYQWPGVFTIEANQRIAEFIFSGMFCFGVISFSYLSAKINQREIDERKESERNESQLNELEIENGILHSKIEEAKREKAEFESRISRLQLEKNQLESEMIEAKSKMDQIQWLEEELENMKKKDELARTCEYCNEILESIDSKRVHKGQCNKNPKNQEKKNLEIQQK